MIEADAGMRREKAYKLLCEHAAHASSRGFRLTMRGNFGEIGPFVDERNLRAWIEELLLRLGPTAGLFSRLFPNSATAAEAFVAQYEVELIKGVRKEE
jgi:hypothetical protein